MRYQDPESARQEQERVWDTQIKPLFEDAAAAILSAVEGEDPFWSEQADAFHHKKGRYGGYRVSFGTDTMSVVVRMRYEFFFPDPQQTGRFLITVDVNDLRCSGAEIPWRGRYSGGRYWIMPQKVTARYQVWPPIGREQLSTASFLEEFGTLNLTELAEAVVQAIGHGQQHCELIRESAGEDTAFGVSPSASRAWRRWNEAGPSYQV